MTVDRSALAAVLRLAAPQAPAFSIAAAVDAALDYLGGGITTADRLPPPDPAALPAPAAGQVRVEVVEASEHEWPDTGLVLTLTLRMVDDPDAEAIRVRFDASRAVARRIAMDAIGGLEEGAEVSALVGRQAVVETRPYTTREGVERLGVAKWIVPRKPRQPGQRPAAVKNRKPEGSSLPGDDISF
jgi:hypothetical protein